MTDLPPAPAPRTEAGRRLLSRLVGMQRDYYHIEDDILAIEQESVAAREAEIRAVVEAVQLVAGMPWPPTCADCGMATEDPDAYHGTDEEQMPEGALCPSTGTFHRWRDYRDAILGNPAAPLDVECPCCDDPYMPCNDPNHREGDLCAYCTLNHHEPGDCRGDAILAKVGLSDAEDREEGRPSPAPTPDEGSRIAYLERLTPYLSHGWHVSPDGAWKCAGSIGENCTCGLDALLAEGSAR